MLRSPLIFIHLIYLTNKASGSSEDPGPESQVPQQKGHDSCLLYLSQKLLDHIIDPFFSAIMSNPPANKMEMVGAFLKGSGYGNTLRPRTENTLPLVTTRGDKVINKFADTYAPLSINSNKDEDESSLTQNSGEKEDGDDIALMLKQMSDSDNDQNPGDNDVDQSSSSLSIHDIR